jgi:hypothetical protein
MGHLSKDLKGEGAMGISRGRAFPGLGTASAKDLRQKGWSEAIRRRSKGKPVNGGTSEDLSYGIT